VAALERFRNEKFARCVERILRVSNPGRDPEPLIHLNTFYAFAKDPAGKENFWGADFFELVYAYASNCSTPDHPAVLLMEQVEREAMAYAERDPTESGLLREVFSAVHGTCQ